MRRTLAGELDSYQMEKRYIRSDGSEVWVMLSVTLVRGADGTPLHFVAHAQDIDARKRADERFVAAERRYRTLVEQLPLCMYIRSLDLTQPNIYVSPQVEAMLGYPVSDWLDDPNLVKRIIHPDDRERVLGEAARVAAAAVPSREEYRYLKPDGTVVWVQDEMHLVRDEQGEPLYVQGSCATSPSGSSPRRSATGCATSSCTRNGSRRSAASPAASPTTSTTC